MRIRYLITQILFFSFSCIGCGDGIFPTQSKPTVPADHTSNFGGVLHVGERGSNESECEECHGTDLRGGVKQINGVWRYGPSCYQCHGKIWEREGGGGRK